MLRAVICKGDPTTHGGKVLEGNERVTTDGRPVAQKGHMTVCPQCKGNFPISEGLAFHTYAGIGTAVDGMQTACGAKLIATQQHMLIDDGRGADGAGPAPACAAASKPEGKYGASFRAVDQRTGQPVPGLAYRLELADGRVLRGVTDQDGYTERVSGHEPSTVELHWEAEVGSGREQP